MRIQMGWRRPGDLSQHAPLYATISNGEDGEFAVRCEFSAAELAELTSALRVRDASWNRNRHIAGGMLDSLDSAMKAYKENDLRTRK